MSLIVVWADYFCLTNHSLVSVAVLDRNISCIHAYLQSTKVYKKNGLKPF